MTLIAGALFLGDLMAVAAIIPSLWLERSLGVSRGVVLDWIIVVTASCGLAAWIAGHLLTRSMARGRTELANRRTCPYWSIARTSDLRGFPATIYVGLLVNPQQRGKHRHDRGTEKEAQGTVSLQPPGDT